MADPVTKPADFGTGEAAIAQRWLSEIALAEKHFATWFTRGDLIIKRYRDERPNARKNARRFAMLWSNVQTLAPAIYANTPKCIVSRRNQEADPTGRLVSEIIERAVNFSLEEYDFDQRMILARNDYLLPGRGQVWVRYEPHFKQARTDLTQIDGVQVTNDTEELYEDVTGKRYTSDEVEADDDGPYVMEDRLDYEEVCCDHLSWKDFLHNPAREWSEVRWVARRVYMSRPELRKRFGAVANTVPLDARPPAQDPDSGVLDEQFKRAVVYEIWDRASRKAYWIAKGFSSAPLDVKDDPLGLKGFFPCPMPLFATLGPDSTIPVPDYVEYQDQAEEIDELTGRIGFLTEALRLNGFYNAEWKGEIQNLLKPGTENTLIPVMGWQSFTEGGKSRGAIDWVPIDTVAAALMSAFETRARIISDIYQITGISDIVRGDTDPNETATAQGIKSQWGALRVRDRQKDIARFARDVIRIKGEIIAEKFSPETLAKMTGVDLFFSEQEKQQAQQQLQMQAQMAQQSGQQPPQPDPAMLDKFQNPTWEEVMAVMRDQAMRSFRVEIETDSTIEPDQAMEKQAALEYANTMGQLLGAALPAVQAAPPLGGYIGEVLKFVSRRFRAGRDLEDSLDRAIKEIAAMPPQQGDAPPPDPNAIPVAQMELQTEQVKQSGEMQRAQLEAQMEREQMPFDLAKLQLQAQLAQRDPNPQVVANG